MGNSNKSSNGDNSSNWLRFILELLELAGIDVVGDSRQQAKDYIKKNWYEKIWPKITDYAEMGIQYVWEKLYYYTPICIDFIFRSVNWIAEKLKIMSCLVGSVLYWGGQQIWKGSYMAILGTAYVACQAFYFSGKALECTGRAIVSGASYAMDKYREWLS